MAWPLSFLFRARDAVTADEKHPRESPEGKAALSAASLRDALGGGPTATGIKVSPDAALSVSAVLACIRVLSEDVAALPLLVYRELPGGGREVARDHPLMRVFSRRPNSWQSRFEFKEMMQVHLCLRGNAFAYIRRNGRGEVLELVPLHPDRVILLEAEDGSLFYQVSRSTRFEESQLNDADFVIPASNILHIRGLSTYGLMGMALATLGREAIGLAMATEKHGGKVFGNGARLGGILKTAGKLSPESKARLVTQWQSAFGGVENTFKTAVLEEGMEWQQLGMTSEDAQYLESRTFQAEEIARIWRIPQHKIGLLSKSTNNNIEHQGLEYYKDSLKPWLERWEAALERDLLTDEEAKVYTIEFDFDSVLRGDFKTRMEGYAVGRQWGWYSINDVRADLGENPVPGGDVYLSPLNMIPAGTEQALADQNAQSQADAKIEELNIRRLKAVGKKLSVVNNG